MCMLQEKMIQITRYTFASLVQISPTVDSSVVNKEQYYFNLKASDLFTMLWFHEKILNVERHQLKICFRILRLQCQ